MTRDFSFSMKFRLLKDADAVSQQSWMELYLNCRDRMKPLNMLLTWAQVLEARNIGREKDRRVLDRHEGGLGGNCRQSDRHILNITSLETIPSYRFHELTFLFVGSEDGSETWSDMKEATAFMHSLQLAIAKHLGLQHAEDVYCLLIVDVQSQNVDCSSFALGKIEQRRQVVTKTNALRDLTKIKGDLIDESLQLSMFADGSEQGCGYDSNKDIDILAQNLAMVLANLNSVINRFNFPRGDGACRDAESAGEGVKTELVFAQSNMQSCIALAGAVSDLQCMHNKEFARRASAAVARMLDMSVTKIRYAIKLLQNSAGLTPDTDPDENSCKRRRIGGED